MGPPAAGGLTALDPKTGAVMWSQTPAASKASSFETPLLLGADRVALLTWNDFSAQQVKREGASWRMDELWRSADLSASVAPPVLLDGHLYGFGSDDLACVEAAPVRTLPPASRAGSSSSAATRRSRRSRSAASGAGRPADDDSREGACLPPPRLTILDQ